MTPPFLLAGPIVRRVEARTASVWVATSKPCTVRLSAWPGSVTAGDAVAGAPFDPGGEAARGQRETLRVGENLHVVVVTATTTAGQPFLPGMQYSYNVVFDPPDGDPIDLRNLGLLLDAPKQPALGYQPGLLPSFVTCPLTIDELIVVQGSCNRIEAGGGPNLMPAIDEMIDPTRGGDRKRPHQLWLTGDQVYADEIPAPLSVLLTAVGRELIGVDERIEVTVAPGVVVRVPLRQANFPAGYRQKLMERGAQLTSGHAASHLLGITERAAMQLHLWSPEVWSTNDDGAVELPRVDTVLAQLEPPLLEALEEVPADVGAERAGAVRVWLAANLTTFKKQKLADAVRLAGEELTPVLAYASRVGLIRRALANVATYMTFDDHDVTDDWNLCQLWQERVLASRMGRSVWRDGLAAFALFQGWGNDPAAFETEPGAAVLAALSRMFPPNEPSPPAAEAVTDLDRLFGLAGQPPLVRWNFQVDGTVHRVVACDTRTRRGFTGRTSPPIQLPDGERQLQIPEGPLPSGLEVLVVVLSQPALDPVMLGELTQGLVSNGFAAAAMISKKMDESTTLTRVEKGALAGLESLDYEGWASRPLEIVGLLERLSTYPRVVVMSGDVHFGVSLALSFWRRGQGLVSTIGQFTSSAVQYITYPEYLVPLLGQGWANDLIGDGYPVDVLAWRSPTDAPVTAPSLLPRHLRRRLLQRPVVVPARGWPADATVDIAPDYAWRVEMLADMRPDDVRPDAVRPEPLLAEFDAADPLHGEHGYAALARRHGKSVRKHANTRRLGIFNKVSRMTFRHDENGRLVAVGEMVSRDHYDEAGPHDSFTIHEVVFDQPVAVPEPTIGA